MQQHTVPQGGQGAEGAPLCLQELRPPGGCRQQLRVPERGAPQRRGVHPGAPGCRRRPDASPHQDRALRILRPRRGRLLPGHGERGGRDDALLRLLQPKLRQSVEGVRALLISRPSRMSPLVKEPEGTMIFQFSIQACPQAIV